MAFMENFFYTSEKVTERLKAMKQKFHLEPPQGLLNDPNGLCDSGIRTKKIIPTSAGVISLQKILFTGNFWARRLSRANFLTGAELTPAVRASSIIKFVCFIQVTTKSTA